MVNNEGNQKRETQETSSMTRHRHLLGYRYVFFIFIISSFLLLTFFFHSNDDSWPLFIITEFTEAESISPQNDAHPATILALPPQIEADILPADVADTIWSLWLDAYNGKPPLEFFFSLKCLFTCFYQYWRNDDLKPQPQPPTSMATFIGLGCIMYTLVLEHSFWSREQDAREELDLLIKEVCMYLSYFYLYSLLMFRPWRFSIQVAYWSWCIVPGWWFIHVNWTMICSQRHTGDANLQKWPLPTTKPGRMTTMFKLLYVSFFLCFIFSISNLLF